METAPNSKNSLIYNILLMEVINYGGVCLDVSHVSLFKISESHKWRRFSRILVYITLNLYANRLLGISIITQEALISDFSDFLYYPCFQPVTLLSYWKTPLLTTGSAVRVRPGEPKSLYTANQSGKTYNSPEGHPLRGFLFFCILYHLARLLQHPGLISNRWSVSWVKMPHGSIPFHREYS